MNIETVIVNPDAFIASLRQRKLWTKFELIDAHDRRANGQMCWPCVCGEHRECGDAACPCVCRREEMFPAIAAAEACTH